MKLNQTGFDFIKANEGCKLQAYRDTRNIWTIGYGHTGLVDGESIKSTTIITQKQADMYLMQNIEEFEAVVNRTVKVKLTQNQFDALIDFVYNIGAGAFQTSTLLQVLNKGGYELAVKQFLSWDKPPELLGRRKKEQTLFLKP